MASTPLRIAGHDDSDTSAQLRHAIVVVPIAGGGSRPALRRLERGGEAVGRRGLHAHDARSAGPMCVVRHAGMQDPAHPPGNQHQVGRRPRRGVELLIDLLEKRVVSRDHEFRDVEVTVVSHIGDHLPAMLPALGVAATHGILIAAIHQDDGGALTPDVLHPLARDVRRKEDRAWNAGEPCCPRDGPSMIALTRGRDGVERSRLSPGKSMQRPRGAESLEGAQAEPAALMLHVQLGDAKRPGQGTATVQRRWFVAGKGAVELTNTVIRRQRDAARLAKAIDHVAHAGSYPRGSLTRVQVTQSMPASLSGMR